MIAVGVDDAGVHGGSDSGESGGPGGAGSSRDAQRDRELRRRADFRAFVRANHPDVGGDPEVFAAGLAQFRAGGPVADIPDGDRFPNRFDGPVSFVDTGNPLGKLAVSIRRWRRRRRRRSTRLD